METATSQPSKRRVGPYCKALQRGAISNSIDGRSQEDRFLRRVEAELVAHVGGSPSFTQRLLIRRAAKMMLRLELLDDKTKDGALIERDGREYGALTNGLRLALRELGIKGREPAKPPSFRERLNGAV